MMDIFTKSICSRCIDDHADATYAVDAFRNYFSEHTLKCNLKESGEILNYLNDRFDQAVEEAKDQIYSYNPFESDYFAQKKNLLTFSNKLPAQKIRNIAEIYKYVWNCIDGYVKSDGSIDHEYRIPE